MRWLPITMTGASVFGCDQGTKTQTRRVLGLPSRIPARLFAPARDGDRVGLAARGVFVPARYRVGDRLWVQETWSRDALTVYPCPIAWYRADFRRQGWDDPSQGRHSRGCTAERGGAQLADCFGCAGRFRWRSPRFMPRMISRIDLEVTDVRVQRLQELTEGDAAAEGARPSPPLSYLGEYELLWDDLNGKRAPWRSDPWVAAVTFRRIR